MRRVDVAGLALKHGTRLGLAGADHPTGTKGEELKAGFRAAGRASGASVDLRAQVRDERDAKASGCPLEVVAPIDRPRHRKRM